MVCFDRPNRSKRRVFRCKDVKRISRYAINTGETKECVLNGVLEELEYKEALCKILRVIRLVREIKSNAVYVAVLSALITIISGISSILKRRDRAQTLNFISRSTIVKRISFVWEAITKLLERTPLGAVLIGLGSIQLLLIAIRDLIDVWDDLIDPLLDAVACEGKE